MRIWLKRQVYVNYLKLEIGVLIALMMPGNERIINLLVIKKLNENLCLMRENTQVYSWIFLQNSSFKDS